MTLVMRGLRVDPFIGVGFACSPSLGLCGYITVSLLLFRVRLYCVCSNCSYLSCWDHWDGVAIIAFIYLVHMYVHM